MSLDAWKSDAELRRLATARRPLGIVLGPASPLLGRAKRPKSDPEHEEQVALFEWARAMILLGMEDLRLLYAIPNWFGTRTARQGGRAKAEGRKAGVPDICLPVPRGTFGALYVEMKAPKGTPTADQLDWIDALNAAGNLAVVTKGADVAKGVILDYLALPRSRAP